MLWMLCTCVMSGSVLSGTDPGITCRPPPGFFERPEASLVMSGDPWIEFQMSPWGFEMSLHESSWFIVLVLVVCRICCVFHTRVC